MSRFKQTVQEVQSEPYRSGAGRSQELWQVDVVVEAGGETAETIICFSDREQAEDLEPGDVYVG